MGRSQNFAAFVGVEEVAVATMKSLPEPRAFPERQSRQAERAATTRAALMLAAEQIFARDGFEAARIEDIAMAAGRSRGAFYANFESKAELFLALREQLARKRVREIRARVQHLSDAAARDRAIKAYLVEEVLSERQLLLAIEFKLFAVRRPEMLKQLAAKHMEMSCRITHDELAPYFPEWRTGAKTEERNTLVVEGLLEGLALNHLFESRVLGATDVAALLPGLIDWIVKPAAGRNE